MATMDLFFPLFVKKREKEKISYFLAYPERWANHLGELVAKEKSIGEPLYMILLNIREISFKDVEITTVQIISYQGI